MKENELKGHSNELRPKYDVPATYRDKLLKASAVSLGRERPNSYAASLGRKRPNSYAVSISRKRPNSRTSSLGRSNDPTTYEIGREEISRSWGKAQP